MNSNIKRLYWQLTVLLLAAHFAGWAPALPLALLLNTLQPLHAFAARRSAAHLEVQVRVTFLGLLLLGTLPALWPLHAAQFVGVNALLVADYCPLARLLALMPWNRRAPLSAAFVRRVLFTPPRPGSILDRLAEPSAR